MPAVMLKGLSAIVFIPDDTAKTGFSRPLMLSSVLGAPLLAWLSDAMYDSGVGRFFLVCHERVVDEASKCLPKEAEVMTTADANAAAAIFGEHCPEAEVSALPGGQPVYYYIISIE